VRELLEQCAEVEKTIAGIYHEMAATEHYSQELRVLFKELAQDEEDHAVQLECALEVPPEIIFPSVQVAPSSNKAQLLLERARAILAEVRSSPPSQAGALQLSVDLEEDFREMHLFAMATFPDEKLRTMFSRFARFEEAHLALLKGYCEAESATPPPL
jgi:rubrerythrin